MLYALSRHLIEPSVFNNFVAASPSIYYHDNYLIKEIETSPTYIKNIENIKLYLTIGELETLENQSKDFEKLMEALGDRKINYRRNVYHNLGHMETAIPTFENGVELFMSR